MILLAGVVLCGYVTYRAIRRHRVPGARPFAVATAAAAVWSLAYVLELASNDPAAKMFWAKTQYLGIVTIPAAWFAFAVQYGESPQKLAAAPKKMWWLSVIPAITLMLVLTNELHGLIWSGVTLPAPDQFLALEVVYGPWFWVHMAYSYTLLLLGSALLVAVLRRPNPLMRWQVGLALFGIALPWIANMLYISGIPAFHEFDLTPFAFSAAALAFTVGLFRFGLLNVVPVAYETVFGGLSDPTLVLDSHDRIVEMNAAAVRLQPTPAHVIGFPLSEVFPVLATTLPSAELTLNDRCYEIVSNPLKNWRGDYSGCVITLHDVTERKQAEAALQRAHNELEATVAVRTEALQQTADQLRQELATRKLAQARYRALFEEAPVMSVLTRNQDGGPVVTDCNRQFAETLGWPKEQVIGRPLGEFYAPESLDQLLAGGYERALAGGFTLEQRELLRSDGRRIETLMQAAPERNPAGEVIGTVAMYTDISEQRLAERRIEAMMEAAPDAMLVADQNGRILLVNSRTAELFGLSEEQLVGSTLNQRLPARVHEAYHLWRQNLLFDPMEARLTEGFEQIVLRGDQTELPVEITLNPVETSDGMLVIAALRDVSERREAEALRQRLLEEVSALSEELRVLARRLAETQETERRELARELHDQVGQNLTALDFNLNLIRRLVPGNTEVREPICERVDASLALLAQTAEQIRNVIADLRPPMLDDFGLLAALRWYTDQFARSLELDVMVEGQEPTQRLGPLVELAFFRITQEALTNIVRHAQASQVVIRLEGNADDGVRLIIEDDGRGLPAEDPSNPNRRRGYGLLNMRERAEAVGGHCRIEPAPGGGTRVVVEAPQ